MIAWLALKYEESMKPKRRVQPQRSPEYYYIQKGRITEVHRRRDNLLYISLTDIADDSDAVARAAHLSWDQVDRGKF